MYRFYIGNGTISENEIVIKDGDVNHIKNVLRMKPGETLIVCDMAGTDYLCRINKYLPEQVLLEIISNEKTVSELPVQITLYQGLPKKDKMELIIQKSVELGVTRIVPVMTKRTVVKLEDAKKEAAKIARWQAIAESAAKQSGRGIIPEIKLPVSWKEAVTQAARDELSLIPYELATGMENTRTVIKNGRGAKTVSIMIGPEGGFEAEEVQAAQAAGIKDITLGKRILRTETAGLALLSVLMYEWETDNGSIS